MVNIFTFHLMVCIGHFHLHKVPPGENCPIHQVIAKQGECYGDNGPTGGYGAERFFKDSDDHFSIKAIGSKAELQTYNFGRPAGCYWLKGPNGLRSTLFFNYVIDPTSTDPAKFVDRGGVCKAPGKGIQSVVFTIISIL